MTQRTLRRILTLATLTLLSATLALAQGEPQPASLAPAINLHNDWAQAPVVAKRKLLVVTLAQPSRRSICRIQSFTPDQLVCKGSFGKTNTYKPQEIAALIIPGNKDFRVGAFLIINVVGAAAMLGILEFEGACIPCFVATGVAAILIARHCLRHRDGIRPTPEVLLYLMPGQTLQVKLH